VLKNKKRGKGKRPRKEYLTSKKKGKGFSAKKEHL